MTEHKITCAGREIPVDVYKRQGVMCVNRIHRLRIQITDKVNAVDGDPGDQAAMQLPMAEKVCSLPKAIGLLRGQQADGANRPFLDKRLCSVKPGIISGGLHGPKPVSYTHLK